MQFNFPKFHLQASEWKEVAQRDMIIGFIKKELTCAKFRGFFLYGGVGTGKTSLLTLIAKGLISGYFAYPMYSTASDAIKMAISDSEQWKRLCRSHMLFLDDLGSEHTSDYANATITELIDARYREGLTTFIASNLRADAHIPRIASRLHDTNWIIQIGLVGKDRRK